MAISRSVARLSQTDTYLVMTVKTATHGDTELYWTAGEITGGRNFIFRRVRTL